MSIPGRKRSCPGGIKEIILGKDEHGIVQDMQVHIYLQVLMTGFSYTWACLDGHLHKSAGYLMSYLHTDPHELYDFPFQGV